jgi:hypothetical protein
MHYEGLKATVTGNAFLDEKNKIEKSTFKDTPEYAQEKKLIGLKKSPDHKKYNKLLNAPKLKTYNEVKNSERLARYQELESYLASEDFKKAKVYMLLKPEEKYRQSEEYKKESALKELENSENIRWYKKVSQSNKFKPVANLELTFEDDFEAPKLDTKKWMTRYFWGDALLKDSFTLADDQHFVTDGKNLDIKNSVLSIVTKKEEVIGKAWHKDLGFIMKTFQYTSGLLHTGNSFRQKYGLFEAKVKLSPSYPVNHAFWMISDKIMPHINVVKYDKKVWMENFWMNGSESKHKNAKKLGASKYTSGYFIFALEWKEGSLIWKVNGQPIATQTTGIPNEPMYINFSSGIHNNETVGNLPAAMEIDWVRCYQFNG